MACTRVTERAWAAGFFDGEGTAYCRKRGAARHAMLTVCQVDRWVLDRFRVAVGGHGHVYGPFVRSTRKLNHRPLFRWETSNRAEFDAVVAALWEFLSIVKRAQIERIRNERAAYERELSAGRMFCKQGHQISDDNVIIDGKRLRCRLCRQRYTRDYRQRVALG